MYLCGGKRYYFYDDKIFLLALPAFAIFATFTSCISDDESTHVNHVRREKCTFTRRKL